MAGVIRAIVTNQAASIYPRMLGGLTYTNAFFSLLSFKIGQGGWVLNQASAQVPRTPDPTLTDLDCILDVTRPPAQQRYPATGRQFFEKNLISSNFSIQLPSTLVVQCLMDTGEPTATLGNLAALWEIGLFAPLQQPGFATVTVTSPGVMTVGGLVGMEPPVSGEHLMLAGATHGENNGTFFIQSTSDDNDVVVQNAGAVVGHNESNLFWARESQKLMVAYGTMSEENKTSSRQLSNYVLITFGSTL